MYIAIDIGGTNTRVACFDSFKKPKIISLKEFQSINDYKKMLRNIIYAIKELKNDKTIKGIGVGFPGLLDEKDALTIKRAVNLPALEGKPLGKDLSKNFQCPVFMENDTLLAALGEAVFGKYAGKEFLFLIWGTGIAGARVDINTKINSRGLVKEIKISQYELGHNLINGVLNRHNCKKRDCLEYFCGGAGIQKRLGKSPKDLNEREWEEITQRFAEDIAKFIRKDPPNLIVFGGGIAFKQSKRIKQIQKILKSKVSPTPKIVLASLGEVAGLFGALALIYILEERKNQGYLSKHLSRGCLYWEDLKKI